MDEGVGVSAASFRIGDDATTPLRLIVISKHGRNRGVRCEDPWAFHVVQFRGCRSRACRAYLALPCIQLQRLAMSKAAFTMRIALRVLDPPSDQPRHHPRQLGGDGGRMLRPPGHAGAAGGLVRRPIRRVMSPIVAAVQAQPRQPAIALRRRRDPRDLAASPFEGVVAKLSAPGGAFVHLAIVAGYGLRC